MLCKPTSLATLYYIATFQEKTAKIFGVHSSSAAIYIMLSAFTLLPYIIILATKPLMLLHNLQKKCYHSTYASFLFNFESCLAQKSRECIILHKMTGYMHTFIKQLAFYVFFLKSKTKISYQKSRLPSSTKAKQKFILKYKKNIAG